MHACGDALLACCMRGWRACRRRTADAAALRCLLDDWQVVIPRPARGGAPDPPGVGLVFLEYQDGRSAEKALLALDGRAFGDGVVSAALFDEARFQAGAYE